MSEIALPSEFQSKLRALLKEEADDFFESYERERVQGLRLNTQKADCEKFVRESPFTLKQIPWVAEGFYYGGEDRPGKHPWHEAGVYYIQEPSAMAVVELLDPRPGECILDLCAAPGGKTTHIGARLKGKGFLLSNEIHPARARILAQNVERMGIANAVVANEDSRRLAECFPVFFDRIVVDAPCSGEGMFRKDQGAREEWSPANVRLCAKRQQEILENAAVMLKHGGRLVYSTCTFSPEENEGTIAYFLELHPEFTVEEAESSAFRDCFSKGRPGWAGGDRRDLDKTVRIWPHKTSGEGHFMAVLRKDCHSRPEEREPKRRYPKYLKDKKVLDIYKEFCSETLAGSALREERDRLDHLILFGDQLYRLPPEMIDFDGLRILRPGLHLGTVKKNRFEPSHAYALYLRQEDAARWCSYSWREESLMKYLKGGILSIEPDQASDVSMDLSGKGWVLMCADGYSLGWAKLAGGILKNHYPKGLRWL